MVHVISDELLHSQDHFDLRLDWKFKKVTQSSTSNLAEILMRTSLPKKLHDAAKFWGIIIFTWSCIIMPFDHDLVQKVKKVTQRSTLNFFKILMWSISLESYNMMHAIPEELLCSQGNMTVSMFESSKRSHKGQYRTRQICWCAEDPDKVTAQCKQYMRSYFKVEKGHCIDFI